MLKRTEDIAFTHDLLKRQMENPNLPMTAEEELEKELSEMTQADVNPAIKLLHDWEKAKKVHPLLPAPHSPPRARPACRVALV